MSGAPPEYDQEPTKNDMSMLLTEQQYLRYLEVKIIDAETAERRVTAYGVCCVQMLSILSRYDGDKIFEKKCPDHARWQGELLACTVGHVSSMPIHGWHQGAPSTYEVRVVGAEGVNPRLSAHPSRSFPEHLEITEHLVRTNLYVAQECRFRTLHFKLRRALSVMKWLQDDFAPLDARTKAARERLQGARAGGETNA
jgi:hypothetical protein